GAIARGLRVRAVVEERGAAVGTIAWTCRDAAARPCRNPSPGVGCPRVMATAKKRKIPASEIVIDNRTLEGALRDLTEQSKENAARSARLEQEAAERSARFEQALADAAAQSAEAAARSARAEEMAAMALKTIGSLLQDLRALAGRTNDRLDTLEKAVGIQP